MSQVSRRPIPKDLDEKIYKTFIESLKNARSSREMTTFFNDLLNPAERTILAKRVVVALLLIRGDYTYDNISNIVRVSKGTIAKVNAKLQTFGKGYQKIIENILQKKAMKGVLSDLVDVFQPIPPKGVNWSTWHKERRKRQKEREQPF